MARAIVVRTVVFDQRLYVGSGSVNRWTRGVTESFRLKAIAKAPVSTRPNTSHGGPPGTLKGSIRTSYSHPTPRILTGEVSVNTHYAKYVLAGTAAQGRQYIYSNVGWANKAAVDKIARRVKRGGKVGVNPGFYMALPRNPQGRYPFILRVHGQKANNFLAEAYNATARRHRALRPMSTRFVYRS